jgi:hypothetical protein
MDSATTAAWVTAWASIGAGAGTVGAFITGGILLLREIRRGREQIELRKRSQARLVHCYAGYKDWLGPAYERYIPAFIVINNSDQPIYGVTVPGATGSDVSIAVVQPEGRRELSMSVAEAEKFGLDRDHTKAPLPARMYFTDAETLTWERTDDGSLKETHLSRVVVGHKFGWRILAK